MSNNKFQTKFLEAGSSANPYISMIEAGLAPAEIKSFIIETLYPYFSNRSVIDKFAVNVLAPEAVNLVRVQDDSWTFSAFIHVWNLYRRAVEADAETAYKITAEFEPLIITSLEDYWSAFYLEESKSALELHEFKYEVFRNIGSLVEANIQPLLRDLLAQIRITRGKSVMFSEVQGIKLGNVVDELYSTFGFPSLFAPPPWDIRLNQWRNIAQHHNSKIQGKNVVCFIGYNKREVILTRDELFSVLQRLFNVFQALKLARTLFLVDHVENIKPYFPKIEMRQDIRLVTLVAGITTQGFRVEKLTAENSLAHAVVYDLLEMTDERLIHASQFLIPLWHETHAASLEIQYFDIDGNHHMTFCTNGEACRRLSEEEISLKEYLKFVNFEKIQRG